MNTTATPPLDADAARVMTALGGTPPAHPGAIVYTATLHIPRHSLSGSVWDSKQRDQTLGITATREDALTLITDEIICKHWTPYIMYEGNSIRQAPTQHVPAPWGRGTLIERLSPLLSPYSCDETIRTWAAAQLEPAVAAYNAARHEWLRTHTRHDVFVAWYQHAWDPGSQRPNLENGEYGSAIHATRLHNPDTYKPGAWTRDDLNGYHAVKDEALAAAYQRLEVERRTRT
jgi:hypothetical protein